ncbi:hypothetical protein GCM10027299_18100 [Larkinella ripae]
MEALLITMMVLTPFGWFIYRLIRYTAKSLGDESPLSVQVSYQITEQEYFTRFDFLFLIFFVLSNLFIIYLAIFFAIQTASTPWHRLSALVMLAVSLYILWWSIRLFRLEWQYWLITKEKTVTLNPADKSVEIATSGDTVYFTVAEVEKIENHTPDFSSGKLVTGYRYFIFHLKDGRRIYLNHNKSYLDFAIADYFKSVQILRIPHKFPWIVAP